MIGRVGVYLSEESQPFLFYVSWVLSKIAKRADFLYLEEDPILKGIMGIFRFKSGEKENFLRRHVEEFFEDFSFHTLRGSIKEFFNTLQDNYDLLFVQHKRQFLHKSIPERLLLDTDKLSLWIYKEPCSASLKKVCIPLDFSERSLRQVSMADYLKSFFNIEYHLVYSLNTDRFKGKLSRKDYSKTLSDKEEEVRHMYSDMFGSKDVKLIVLEGNPYKYMAEYINSSDYDMVIIGKRGKGMRERMGSVSLYMVRNVRCPLIVL
ncbi:MAG: universal stress protein [Acidobacteria bacterium]|jgi:nucleotide-binding universal stress UspA family protein|nr:MAG: universal stress protein [Acidobacteriota bacterium]